MVEVILAGGSGWLGMQVGRCLQARGVSVISIGRRSEVPAFASSHHQIDLGSAAMLDVCNHLSRRRIRSFINCIGCAHRPNESPEDIRRFLEVNCAGVGSLIDLACRVRAENFIHLSSVAVYDWTRTAVADENSPVEGSSAYAKSKHLGEQLCARSGLDYRIVRLATVFGRGDRANFAKLACALRRRSFLMPGSGEARKSVMPVSLASRLIAELALREEVPHRFVNLALPEAPSLRAICESFSTSCGCPLPWNVPLGVIGPAARIGDWIAYSRPNFPLTSVNLRKLITSTVVDTRRMQEIWPDETWGDFSQWLALCADYYCDVDL